MLRWFWKNLSSLVLALALATLVWIVAVTNENPTEIRELGPISINYIGLRQGLLIVGEEPPSNGSVSVRAPISIWELISAESVSLTVDIGGLEEGTHRLPVEPTLDVRPALVSEFDPISVQLTLERAATSSLDIEILTIGEPQLGYRTTASTASPDRAIVLGPVSVVQRVDTIRADVNVTDRRQNFESEVPLITFDRAGNLIEDVELDPATVLVQVEIEPRERFRLVSVVPDLAGEENLAEQGYRLTDVSVTPEVVTVFSADQAALDELPGFVFTLPLDLTGATGDLERRLSLDLPEQISPVEGQGVLVQVSISPVEGTITIDRQVEIRGLAEGLFAQLSPGQVEIILNGPLPALNSLQLEDVRVIVDLLDLEIGTHAVPPQVIIAPTDVEHEPIFPSTIEVTITNSPPAPTPTP
jgi:YbbR domain-containing protein